MTGRQIVDHVTARRAALIATIWLPLAIVVAAEIVLIIAGSLSDHPVIVHWAAAGADRTGPWWTYAVLVAAIGLPFIAVIGFFMIRATRVVGMNAWMPAIAMGVTVFHTVGMGVGSVLLNASPLAPALPLAGGLVLAIAAALLTWRLLPREDATAERVDPADTIPMGSNEVAAWAGRVELPAWFMAVIAAAAATIIVIGVALLLTAGPRIWPVFFPPAFLLVVLLATAQFVVRAGPAGFAVRSAIGWPRFTIPTSNLSKAGVVVVDPVADFGGWGLRWVIGPDHKGRWGVITRRGPGLEVFRRDGRSIVVTVDDAGTAAAVLETYAKKQA